MVTHAALSFRSNTKNNLQNFADPVPQTRTGAATARQNLGTPTAHTAAMTCSWVAFAVSLLILIFYTYHSWKSTCGWEEVYVCTVELIKVTLEIFFETYAPATITQANGVHTTWLRYGEWLLTCPVILIHLSNLTGLQDDYSKRTMRLLVSDIGTIVMGTTAAFSTGPTKIVFFLLGCCYAVNTFYSAGQIYIESYFEVPEGTCRTLVKTMAWVFFTSWFSFPFLFLLGPEGFGHLSPYGSIIAHTFVDLMSKNLWGILGHCLRVKVHEHIIVHGDIRKKQVISVAGKQVEVNMLVDDENEEGAVRSSTAVLARRNSFITMRDNLKAKGINVRASLDGSAAYRIPAAPADLTATCDPSATAGHHDADAAEVVAVIQPNPVGTATSPRKAAPPGSPVTARPYAAQGATSPYGAPARSPGRVSSGAAGFGGTAVELQEPVRVVLGVTDASQVEYLREQFALLSVPVAVVPALGADAVLQVISQATQATCAVDCVLLAPELLSEHNGGSSLITRLKAMEQRVCAFGWTQASSEAFAAAGIDGWVEGPSWGASINAAQLATLLLQMNAQRISASDPFTGLHSRPFSNLDAVGLSPRAGAHSVNPLFTATPSSPTARSNRTNSTCTMAALVRPTMSPTVSNSRETATAAMQSSLYKTDTAGCYDHATTGQTGRSAAGAAMGSQPAGGPTASAGAAQQQQQGPRGIAALNESELLQSLLSEIARLKDELGQ